MNPTAGGGQPLLRRVAYEGDDRTQGALWSCRLVYRR